MDDFRLVYLTERRAYGVEELSKCVGSQLSASADAASWLNRGFFSRFAEAMNRSAKIVETKDDSFLFGFVGLFDYLDEPTGKNVTFFFMPKFCNIGNGKSVSSEMRDAVLLAIDRFSRESELPEVIGEATQDHAESLLELAVRVLRDYLENGVYTVRRRELEHNGQGEIDWDTTIDQYQPVFQNGRPVYMDTATELALSDEDHYITRLHQSLVTTWGRKLEELGLATVLQVNVPLLSEYELDRFGDAEIQIGRIRKEMDVQFVTKSRHTLSLMKELVERASNNEQDHVEQLSFGVSKAEHLWETACAEVLGSMLDKPICECGLERETNVTFRDYMPRPIWKQVGKDAFSNDDDAYSEKSGWRLDFIRTWPSHEKVEKLVILDAKYYNVSWPDGGSITGQPGIGDIAKQIFYQMAFQNLIKDKEMGFVNAFLFPEDEESKDCQKNDAGHPTIRVSETVQLGWADGKTILEEARAFSGVNLFAVRIPGIELFRRYAHYEGAKDWFSTIATVDTDKLLGDADKK